MIFVFGVYIIVFIFGYDCKFGVGCFYISGYWNSFFVECVVVVDVDVVWYFCCLFNIVDDGNLVGF